jgi:hypothetical protein
MASFSYSRMDRTSRESSASSPGPQASSARHSTWARPGISNQQMQKVIAQVTNQGGASAGSGGGPVLQRQPAPQQKQPPPTTPNPATPVQTPAKPAQTTAAAQTVKIPDHIRASSTPDEMKADRIIPGKETWVDVELGGTPDPASPVIFSIADEGKGAGSVSINEKDTVEISQKGTVTLKLKGKDQTEAKEHAGKLKLVATQGGKVLASGKGFSVSAIPQNMSFEYKGLIKGDFRGIRVFYNWDSDSDNKTDLKKAWIAERVEHHGTGSLKRIFPVTSCYQPAEKRTLDEHGVAIAGLKSEGKDVVHQTFMFKDDRTGAVNIPMKKSGFQVIHEVKQKDDKSGLQVITSKKGADMTATDPNTDCKSGAITSKAGDGLVEPKVQEV